MSMLRKRGKKKEYNQYGRWWDEFHHQSLTLWKGILNLGLWKPLKPLINDLKKTWIVVYRPFIEVNNSKDTGHVHSKSISCATIFKYKAVETQWLIHTYESPKKQANKIQIHDCLSLPHPLNKRLDVYHFLADNLCLKCTLLTESCEWFAFCNADGVCIRCCIVGASQTWPKICSAWFVASKGRGVVSVWLASFFVWQKNALHSWIFTCLGYELQLECLSIFHVNQYCVFETCNITAHVSRNQIWEC